MDKTEEDSNETKHLSDKPVHKLDVGKLLKEKYNCMSLPTEISNVDHLSPEEIVKLNPRYYNYKLCSDEHRQKSSPSFNLFLSTSAIVIATVFIFYLHNSNLTINVQ
ncbi:uncharacterized protein LOC106669190 isoform X1 [Cimex lectularius]|uniref:Uncharacterized protein n=1 Tax=Cimex lectularius TaxID=79782 RepID=A0A8I6TJ47_CIMLE|nr:uncharacterized protein LOC106669190 isoform X1 [Cimex lectularius]XP_014253992.1 uncharacterized protein LOC106669190 isoform X1 [Cimex lectularius]